MARVPMSPTAASAVLNVGMAASRQEVDRAFRARARLCHPDRFAGASAAEQAAASAEFIRACDARDVLHNRLTAAAAEQARRPAGPGRHAGSSTPSPGSAAPSGATRPPPPGAPAMPPDGTRPAAPGGTRPAPGATRPPPSGGRPRSGTSTPQTLTFADYVRARDAASWTYASQTGPPRDWPPPPHAAPQPGGRADGGRAQTTRPPDPRSPAAGAQNGWPGGPRDWAPPAPSGATGGPWRPVPRRSRTPWRVFLTVLGVLVVGAYLAMQLSNQLSPGITQVLVPPPGEASTDTDLLVQASVLPVVDDATLMANCTSEFGCWVWSVTTQTNCPAATVTVGFSDTPDGASTRTTTRQVAAQAEVPFLIVEEGLSAAPEFAGIQTITC